MSSKDYVVVAYGHKYVYGKVADPLKKIRDEMAEYNLYAILMVFSKVALTFIETDNSSNKDTQTKLLKAFFPLEVRKKIVKVITNGDSERWAFFTEQCLDNLVKIALESAPEEGGKDIDDPVAHETVGKWFLLATDAVLDDYDTPLELPVDVRADRIRQQLTTQHYLVNNERLAFSLCRTQAIYDIAKNNKHHFNLDSTFQDVFGGKVNFKQYCALIFFLMTRFSIANHPRNIDTDWIINKELWFKNVKLDKETKDALLERISFSPSQFGDLHKQVLDELFGGKDQYLNNFMVFMKRPLIITSELNIVCPFPQFLADKGSSGVYWTIENHLLATGQDKLRKTFPSVWGDAFEEYINQRLASLGGSFFFPNPNIAGTERADGILNLPSTVCFFESKSPHFTYLAKLLGKTDLLEPTLNQILGKNREGKFKGLGQITQNIRWLRSGKWQAPFEVKGKKFLPIIVVEDPLPLNEYTRRYYERFAKIKGSFYEAHDILPFIILDAGEVETLEAIGQRKGLDEVEKLLVDYSSIHLKRNVYGFCEFSTSLKNYLYSIGYKVPDNQYMKKYFDNMTNEIRTFVKPDKPVKKK